MAIEGSVEEAKALYKPPEDSQGELGCCCCRQAASYPLQAEGLGGGVSGC